MNGMHPNGIRLASLVLTLGLAGCGQVPLAHPDGSLGPVPPAEIQQISQQVGPNGITQQIGGLTQQVGGTNPSFGMSFPGGAPDSAPSGLSYAATGTGASSISYARSGGTALLTAEGGLRVNVPSTQSEDVTVRTRRGDIDLYVARGLSAALDLSSSDGTVTNQGVALANSVASDRHLSGTMGRGTHTLSVTAEHGSITLHPF